MTLTYVISPTADADLDDRAAYFAGAAGDEVAVRFLDSAAASFAAIARMPGLGEPWSTTNPRLSGLRARRVDGFASHLIFYRPTDAGVEIVRVLNATRDLDAALGDS